MHFAALSLALAAAVSASPIEQRQAKTATLSVSQVNNVKNAKSLVAAGQQRINKINGVQKVGAQPEASSGTVTNEDVSYVAPVSIGGKTWQLIVDTGCK